MSCRPPSASRSWSTPTTPTPPTSSPSRPTASAARPTATLRVFRTIDGGETWEPSGTGLPDDDAYLSVLRDGFGTDGLSPSGLYLGTRTGEVFGSVDGGEHWSELARHLPPVAVREGDGPGVTVSGPRLAEILRPYADGATARRARPSPTRRPSVARCSTPSTPQHPGVGRRVRDEGGAVRSHVNVFVGPDNVRDLDGLATVVPAGVEVAVLPAVSGG